MQIPFFITESITVKPIAIGQYSCFQEIHLAKGSQSVEALLKSFQMRSKLIRTHLLVMLT